MVIKANPSSVEHLRTCLSGLVQCPLLARSTSWSTMPVPTAGPLRHASDVAWTWALGVNLRVRRLGHRDLRPANRAARRGRAHCLDRRQRTPTFAISGAHPDYQRITEVSYSCSLEQTMSALSPARTSRERKTAALATRAGNKALILWENSEEWCPGAACNLPNNSTACRERASNENGPRCAQKDAGAVSHPGFPCPLGSLS